MTDIIDEARAVSLGFGLGFFFADEDQQDRMLQELGNIGSTVEKVFSYLMPGAATSNALRTLTSEKAKNFLSEHFAEQSTPPDTTEEFQKLHDIGCQLGKIQKQYLEEIHPGISEQLFQKLLNKSTAEGVNPSLEEKWKDDPADRYEKPDGDSLGSAHENLSAENNQTIVRPLKI